MVNGSGNGARSGAQALILLASPLNVLIVCALVDGPMPQMELRRATGVPAQTTLRAHLNVLSRIGVVVKQRHSRFPGTVELELTDAGRDLSVVTASLERWLAGAPGGELPIGSAAAKAAIKAMAESWSTTMLRALASGPLTLTELDRVIGALSYPALERRLAAMRLAQQVEARTGNGRGTPYAVTDWLRHGVAPIVAAVSWEQRHLAAGGARLTRVDTEAIFLLAMPLLRLPLGLSGSCRMAVEISNAAQSAHAGVLVEVGDGRIASCTTRLRGRPNAWASGSTRAWLAALTEADPDGLELGGNGRLARALLNGLHQALFGAGTRSRPKRYNFSE